MFSYYSTVNIGNGDILANVVNYGKDGNYAFSAQRQSKIKGAYGRAVFEIESHGVGEEKDSRYTIQFSSSSSLNYNGYTSEYGQTWTTINSADQTIVSQDSNSVTVPLSFETSSEITTSTTENTVIYTDTEERQLEKFFKAIQLKTIFNGSNLFYEKNLLGAVQNSTFTTAKGEFKSAQATSTLSLTSCDPFDALLTAYSQNGFYLGGIITGPTQIKNVNQWFEVSPDNVSYADETFAIPYQITGGRPAQYAAGNNFIDPFIHTYLSSSDLYVKTTKTTSSTYQSWFSNGSTSSATSVYPILSSTHVIQPEVTESFDGGNGAISEQEWAFFTYSSYNSFAVVDEGRGLQSYTVFYNRFTTSKFLSFVSHSPDGAEGATGFQAVNYVVNPSPRVLVNGWEQHDAQPATVFFKNFNRMICPFGAAPFSTANPFFSTFSVSQKTAATKKDGTFNPKIPIFKIIEDVSSIVDDMYFTSTDSATGYSSKSYASFKDVSTYLSLVVEEGIYVSEYTTYISFKYTTTTTSSAESTFGYSFKITSSLSNKASFNLTRWLNDSSSTGNFEIELLKTVKDKTLYYSSVFLTDNNYAFEFKTGAACASFLEENLTLVLGLGFWTYTQKRNNYTVNQGREDVVRYSATSPKTLELDPKKYYLFKHILKAKCGYYGDEHFSLNGLDYLFMNTLHWWGAVGPLTLLDNIYFTEQAFVNWSDLNSTHPLHSRNPYRKYIPYPD